MIDPTHRTVHLIAAGLVLMMSAELALGQLRPTGTDVTDLVGVWGGKRTFGPTLTGSMTIMRGDSGWRAEIAGYRLEVDSHGDVLSFELAGDLGSFRGRIEPETGAIHGQWIQPGAVGMFGQRFSTPVALVSSGPTQWRGLVRPLEDRVRLYVSIGPKAGGKFPSFLRNPEVNFGRLFNVTDVLRNGHDVDFIGRLAWRKEDEPRALASGILRDSTPAMLSVYIEDLGGTYDLSRLDPRLGSDYYPSRQDSYTYQYTPPAPRHDRWKTSDLPSVGMSVKPIEALVRRVVSTPMSAIDAPWIDAILIARHGKLVFEAYFHGHGPDRTHDVRSASKSLTSTLVGAAIHAGRMSLDAKVYEVMNGDTTRDDLDPRAARMTVKDLITMSSGLACDDWDSSSPGNEDRMQEQDEQPDWNRYILDLPMIHEPGEHAAYCSGGMSLAGGMVAKAMDRPLTDIFDRLLARPLQLGIYHTNLMPNGEAYAGGGVRITGRDFLKFGQLMLDRGEWNGRRLLDESWPEAATTPRHVMGTTHREGYGYGWWLFDYSLDGRTWKAYYAGGNGGNYIICVPELSLAIVFLASNYNQPVQHETKYDYVPEFILRSSLRVQKRARDDSQFWG